MRSLNLDQLRALETVVELASFTGAARRLNLSQSAISVQIRELEERCGVRLVERLGKKAYATAAGREVIEHARRISEEADAITSAMRRFREGWIGRVHIGAALTALMYLLPPALQKLRAEHPGIDLFVSNATTAGMVDGVLRNEIDIGVVTLPVEDSRLTITPLHIDPLVAILPASNRDIPPEITGLCCRSVSGARVRRRQPPSYGLAVLRPHAAVPIIDGCQRCGSHQDRCFRRDGCLNRPINIGPTTR
jgi:DNA-binding transcriptional LysR family regulator